MSVHDLKAASTLLLDCVATFSCTELCSYNEFIFYTLLSNVIFLDRNSLRKKIVNDPHVITAVRDLPNAHALVNTIYQCNYKGFFEAVSLLL
jgi:26S proteasome regulatory subunit N7